MVAQNSLVCLVMLSKRMVSLNMGKLRWNEQMGDSKALRQKKCEDKQVWLKQTLVIKRIWALLSVRSVKLEDQGEETRKSWIANRKEWQLVSFIYCKFDVLFIFLVSLFLS